MATALESIQTVKDHAENLKNGKERVQPGDPYTISSAAQSGEGVWQGDLGIRIVDSPDYYGFKISKYKKVKKLDDSHRKLVPGDTDGAKHHLDSIDGVEMWLPEDFYTNPDIETGPIIRISEPRSVVHTGSGRHGTVHLDPIHCYQFTYQQIYDQFANRTRRSRD